MLHASEGSDRIDVVFDVYKDHSIKATGRTHPVSEDGVAFNKIMAGHKIQNWRRSWHVWRARTNTTFLAENWIDQEKRAKLGNKSMFVACGDLCLKRRLERS